MPPGSVAGRSRRRNPCTRATRDGSPAMPTAGSSSATARPLTDLAHAPRQLEGPRSLRVVVARRARRAGVVGLLVGIAAAAGAGAVCLVGIAHPSSLPGRYEAEQEQLRGVR